MRTTVKLTKLERENILTNAEMHSCIGYWVEEFESIKYSPYHKDDYRVLSITLKCADDATEGFAGKIFTVDHKTIQKGIDLLFTLEGFEGVKSSIIEDDADAEVTDVLIQLGLFGECVYG